VEPFHYGEDSRRTENEQEQPSTPVDWLVGLILGLFRILFATHTAKGYDPMRDNMEKTIIRYALQHELPVLGICRGAQLMNVALGGSLHQDIGHFYTEETSNVRSILPRKSIEVSQDSRLYRMLGTLSCTVNALHNQSIKELGKNVVVSAIEPSGVVQAIEKHDHRFFIGVQWHPEYMPQSKTQLALFDGLVHSAMTNAQG
jgi:putative glutamine amidotransferase